MRSLDDLDLAILAELEQNAKIPVSELARRLGSPQSTVRDRIRRLEEEGVIRNYAAVIDPEKLGLGIKAIIEVSRAQHVSLDDFFSEPAQVPEITTVQILTGDIDELITVYARDVDHLKEIIYSKVGLLPGLTRMSTTIVLDERSFPLVRRLGGHAEEE
mgnify:CR=1 FL=1